VRRRAAQSKRATRDGQRELAASRRRSSCPAPQSTSALSTQFQTLKSRSSPRRTKTVSSSVRSALFVPCRLVAGASARCCAAPSRARLRKRRKAACQAAPAVGCRDSRTLFGGSRCVLAAAMAVQLYRGSTIGNALTDALDEMARARRRPHTACWPAADRDALRAGDRGHDQPRCRYESAVASAPHASQLRARRACASHVCASQFDSAMNDALAGSVQSSASIKVRA
jgi:hypothetical protein